jgi:hypothetical protein
MAFPVRADVPVALAVLLLSSACREPADETPRAPERSSIASARAVPFAAGAFTGRAIDLAVLDAHVVVLDDKARFHVFDPAGRHLWTDDLAQEDGSLPGEGATLERDGRRPGSLWVHDRKRSRALRFDLAPGAPDAKVRETVVFPEQPAIFETRWLDATRIVASGLFEDGRFAVFDTTGHRVGSVGEIPRDDRSDDSPAYVRQHAYMGPITTAPGGNRFAAATRHADEISFFAGNGRLLRRVRGSSNFDPVYSVQRTKGVAFMTSGDDLRFGYIDLASNDSFVFALFSGRERMHPDGQANYGRYVQVFDWKGRLVSTTALGFSASSITAPPAGGQVLAIRRHPTGGLVKVDLDVSRN